MVKAFCNVVYHLSAWSLLIVNGLWPTYSKLLSIEIIHVLTELPNVICNINILKTSSLNDKFCNLHSIINDCHQNKI